MIQVAGLAFSCYAVSDMPRSRAFYEGVLGLRPVAVTVTPAGEWTEYELGPHTLSLGCAPEFQKPSPDGCIVALEVTDFDSAIAHLKAAGAKFRMEPFPTGVCRMAMILDPDGNTLCIHRRNA